MNKIKLAIVTTLKEKKEIIDKFYKYHVNIGFDHFFFFFDDANDKLVHNYEKYTNITVFNNNLELLELYKKYSHPEVYRKTFKLRENLLAARQILNVEVAIQFSKITKIDYILHIDVDELFFLNGISINEYFNYLNKKNIYNKRFLVKFIISCIIA